MAIQISSVIMVIFMYAHSLLIYMPWERQMLMIYLYICSAISGEKGRGEGGRGYFLFGECSTAYITV